MTAALYTWETQGIFATQLYAPRSCAAMVARAKKAQEWCDAEIVIDEHGASQANPASRWARILRGPLAASMEREFEERIRRLVKPLIQNIWGANLSECRGTQLIRYRKGGHYVPHSDVGSGELANRYFTVLCYLNENFEGGKTRFPSLRHAATPSAGKAIVFPSSYLHCAEPVMQGGKFILLTWVCGPVPVRWI
jgi:predicted 2-oxoglutarate/Fe(II)-dependent dioxygenase YbiX